MEGFLGANLEEFDGIDILCDAFCHVLGILHGVYHGGLPVGHVAAGEYTLAIPRRDFRN